MGISKPTAVVATMLAVAPFSAEAVQQGQQAQDKPTIIQVSPEAVSSVCTIPDISARTKKVMTMGVLMGDAETLEIGLTEAMTVTEEEKTGARVKAQQALDKGKQDLKAKVAPFIREIEALKAEMNASVDNLPVNSNDSTFEQGGERQNQLDEWERALIRKKAVFVSISNELPALQASVQLTNEGIQKRDVRDALTSWGKATGITCPPDTVGSFVVTHGIFPLNKESLPKNQRPSVRGVQEGSDSDIGSIGMKKDGSIPGDTQKPIFRYAAKVKELTDEADLLSKQAQALPGEIDKMTL